MLLGKHILNGSSGPSIPVGEKWTFTSNGSWIAPAKGNYKITLVGAGGKGGDGGEVYTFRCTRARGPCGGGGGGGGAGETVIQTHNLRQADVLTITIGQPNSNPSKVTGAVAITANGGSSGGKGGVNDMGFSGNGIWDIHGGSVGGNYGSGGSSGGGGREVWDCWNRARGAGGYGGAGKVSDYGNGYGQGGQGGNGATGTYCDTSERAPDSISAPSSCSGRDYYWYTEGSGPGYNGTAGICVIEYMGR